MCIAEQEYCSLTEALGMDVMEVIERGSTSTGIATVITVVCKLAITDFYVHFLLYAICVDSA